MISTTKFCAGGKCQKSNDGHDAILQVLDRKIGNLYFPKEHFEPTVDRWNGIPLVFAVNHPDLFTIKRNDMEEALKKVNGAIVGEVTGARLDLKGHPKLRATMQKGFLTASKLYHAGKISKQTFDRTRAALAEIEKLLAAGKLSLSTAFLAPDDGVRLTDAVHPDHVLLFPEDMQNVPVDLGSGILNKEPAEKVIADRDQTEQTLAVCRDLRKSTGRLMEKKKEPDKKYEYPNFRW
jgi:hypothetical protein